MLAFLLAAALLPADEYASRASKLEGKKDAKAWLALADFAEEKLLLDKREEALRKVLESDPKNASAHQRLDEVQCGKDWLPAEEADAKEIAENEARKLVFYGSKWMTEKEAGKLREADRKALGWAVEVKIDTPLLAIYAGKDLAYARRVARILENETQVYLRLYGKVWKMETKIKPINVFLFPDMETYQRMSGEEPGNPAVYLNDKRALYVSGGDQEALPYRTINAVHEMLHALDDNLAHVLSPFVPFWAQEGRAHHFGYAVQGLQVLPGHVRVPPKDLLIKNLQSGIEATPLPAFLALDNKAFMDGKQDENYAQAWALVHFLFEGDEGRHAEAFRKYLSGFPAKSNLAAFEATVGKASDLQEPYARYVKEVLIPLGRASQGKP